MWSAVSNYWNNEATRAYECIPWKLSRYSGRFTMTFGVGETTVLPLRNDEDVVRLRKQVREDLVAIGFSLLEQTKMVTAASDLARSPLRYGGGGEAHVVQLADGARRGLELSF